MAIWSAEIKELENLHESLKGQLPDLEKELEQLIRTEDANVIMLYSRRCLEVIITDLCECELKRERGTEPLKGVIDKLNKDKKIPAHIASSMYGLNELSTYGAHPKDFDPEQVKPVLVNLDIIIKWYLKYKDFQTEGKSKSEEKQAEKLFNNLKKRAKTEYISATSFYLIHRVRGEEEMALKWLKKACDEHDTMLPYFRADPILIPEGSKYMALLKEKGLDY